MVLPKRPRIASTRTSLSRVTEPWIFADASTDRGVKLHMDRSIEIRLRSKPTQSSTRTPSHRSPRALTRPDKTGGQCR